MISLDLQWSPSTSLDPMETVSTPFYPRRFRQKLFQLQEVLEENTSVMLPATWDTQNSVVELGMLPVSPPMVKGNQWLIKGRPEK